MLMYHIKLSTVTIVDTIRYIVLKIIFEYKAKNKT